MPVIPYHRSEVGSAVEHSPPLVQTKGLITGKILAAGDEQPIPGAAVSGIVCQDARIASIATASSEADGKYQLMIPLEDASFSIAQGLAVVVKAPGFEHGYHAVDPEALTVSKIEKDFLLRRGWNVVGKVIDEHLRPVYDARVTISDDGRVVSSTTTNGGGEYSLPVFAPGEYEVYAEQDGLGSARNSLFVASTDARLSALVLCGAAGIFGELRLPNGQPAAGLAVRASLLVAENPFGDGMLETSATTGDMGQFALLGLRHGTYAITVNSNCNLRPSELATGETFRTIVAENAYRVDLAVTHDGRAVAADSVIFTLGPGKRLVKVCAAPDQNDRYLFYCCESGEVSIEATKGEWSQTKVITLDSFQTVHEVIMPMLSLPDSRGTIELEIRGSNDVPYSLHLWNTDNGAQMTSQHAGGQHLLVIPDLSTGTYRVRWLPILAAANPPEFRFARDLVMRVEGEGRTRGSIEIHEGAILRVLMTEQLEGFGDSYEALIHKDDAAIIHLNSTRITPEGIRTDKSFSASPEAHLTINGSPIETGDWNLIIRAATGDRRTVLNRRISLAPGINTIEF